jgi:hypothetical protein
MKEDAMSALPAVLSGVVGERVSLAFALLLVVHVVAGLTCVATGAIAMTARKRKGRHPWFGTAYYWALAVAFVTATGMAGIRWEQDAYLFLLGTVAFAVASVGYAARRIRWRGWTGFHLTGMSLSYIVLLTAFYVDNGPRLPLWSRLPTIALWIGPSIIGLPLVARAMVRHTRMAADVRATAGALAGLLDIASSPPPDKTLSTDSDAVPR